MQEWFEGNSGVACMDLGERLEVLERLGRLRAQGALSEVEFAAEKAKLIGSVAAGEVAGVLASDPSRATVEVDSGAGNVPDDYQVHPAGYGDTAGPKLIGGALALLIVVGFGYWFLQSSSDASPSSLSETSANSTRNVRRVTVNTPLREQLVGTWGSEGGECDGGEVTLSRDGSYVTQEGGGEWTLSNGRLSLTDWNPSSAQVSVTTGGALRVAWSNGETEVWGRCKPTASPNPQPSAEAALNAAGAKAQQAAQDVEDAMRDVESALANADAAVNAVSE